MKGLLIAEKPDLMRKIKAVYDSHKSELNYTCDFCAQVGHLITLKTPKEIDEEKYGKWILSDFPIVYPYQYKVKPDTADVFSAIKKLYDSGKYDFIIHAGDPDQEGELLVRLVLDRIGNKLPVKRFWTNDLSDASILGALKNLKNDTDYNNLFNAAILRQHVDFQYGMNYSPVTSLKMNDLCRVGRVKAVIISIIVARENEIANYVETKTYKPMFLYKDLEFVYPEGLKSPDEAKKMLPMDNKAKVIDVKVENKNKKPEKLFKLSTLQMAAFKAMKLSADDTLATLQSLYEKRVVTYPRSDCEYISTETDIEQIKNKIIKNYPIVPDALTKTSAELLKDKSYCNDKAIAKEGHTAIIPTGESASLSGNEKTLYDIICKRFLGMWGANKVTKHTKVLAINEKNPNMVYEYTEKEDVIPGYEFIYDPHYEVVRGSGITFTKDMVLNPVQFSVKECTSTPPSRYNVASLLKFCDNPEGYEGEDGEKIKYTIGTPATRAKIIEECIQNGYIYNKNGVYSATQKAILLIKNFADISIFDVTESGKLEEILIKVRSGELDGKEGQDIFLKKMALGINQMKGITATPIKERGGMKIIGKCPKCGANVAVGKYGAFCVDKCGMFLTKAMGKDLSEKQVEDLLNGKKILVKNLSSVKDKSKKYDAYLKVKGVSSFTYKKQDGTMTTGYGYDFEMTFPKKKGE